MKLAAFATTLVVLAGSFAFGCGSDDSSPDFESDESELSASLTQDLGAIAPGETKTVEYTPAPKYRAFSFTATKGDVVDFWVRSPTGDAVAYLLRENRSNLTQNDNANAETVDAHVTTKIASTGKYYVAFRERSGRAARFSVSFSPPPAQTGAIDYCSDGIDQDGDGADRICAPSLDPDNLPGRIPSEPTVSVDILDAPAGGLALSASKIDLWPSSAPPAITLNNRSTRTASVFLPGCAIAPIAPGAKATQPICNTTQLAPAVIDFSCADCRDPFPRLEVGWFTPPQPHARWQGTYKPDSAQFAPAGFQVGREYKAMIEVQTVPVPERGSLRNPIPTSFRACVGWDQCRAQVTVRCRLEREDGSVFEYVHRYGDVGYAFIHEHALEAHLHWHHQLGLDLSIGTNLGRFAIRLRGASHRITGTSMLPFPPGEWSLSGY